VNPRAGGAFEEAKLSVVRKYLSEQFPTFQVRESYAFDRTAQEFRIWDRSAQLHTVIVAREFLTDKSADQIAQLIALWGLAWNVRHAGQSAVMVTNTGVQIEGE